MFRGLVSAAAAVAVVVTLGGCGGVEAKSWAKQVCQALTPWRTEIGALTQQVGDQMKGATTVQQTRENMLRLLGGAEAASETARRKVTEAGEPDVANGAQIARTFTKALTTARDAYGKARRVVETLPTAPEKQFYDGVATAVETLGKEYVGPNLDNLSSTELKRAFNEVPECR